MGIYQTRRESEPNPIQAPMKPGIISVYLCPAASRNLALSLHECSVPFSKSEAESRQVDSSHLSMCCDGIASVANVQSIKAVIQTQLL